MKKSYVIITPARNEEMNIEKTLKSVISQTILPKKWVIVSDGSTDRTNEIVESYASKYDFIHFLPIEKKEKYNFGSKIDAFNKGFKELGDVTYDFIGNLDGDIAFSPYYYEEIINKFNDNPKLGIAGGQIIEFFNGIPHRHIQSLNTVAGAVHLFKRECYEEIGGFKPLKEGGYDALAAISARMKGWQVETFPSLDVYHLKRYNSGYGNVFKSKWQLGERDYLLGNHPVFETLKCIYRLTEKPFFIGTFIRLAGYTSMYLKKVKCSLPEDVFKYVRYEQKIRMFSLFLKNR